MTVEREEILVIKQPLYSALAWCAECGAQVRLVTLDEAIAFYRRKLLRYWRAESGQIHFVGIPEVFLLVCLSLLS